MTYAFYLDLERCVGCQACAVACMDENDLDVERERVHWRQVFAVENGAFPEVKVTYVSLACMHCQDAPCLMACPTGAISKNQEIGAILVNPALCIGCHSCSLACPFGVPRFGPDGKMQKCRLCEERVAAGLEPACVRTCPTRALKFGPVNQLAEQVESRAAARLAQSAG